VDAFNLIRVFSKDFRVSLSLTGLAVTLYMLPFVISQVASGAATEMLGARRALLVGSFIFSASCLNSSRGAFLLRSVTSCCGIHRQCLVANGVLTFFDAER